MAGAVRFAGETIGLVANADLTALQFRFMKLVTGSKVDKATAATDIGIIGILQNKPKSAQVADVRHFGGSKLQVAAAVAVGAALTTDANGKGVTTVTAGNFVRAYALEAAGADGDIISVLLVGPYKV